MEPHWQSSTERMRACEVVLCLDDTTELNFNGQEIAGLGPLSYVAQRGMYVHATYAVTPQREPLGVLNAWMWSRECKDARGKRGGIKESTRWIEGYERDRSRAADRLVSRPLGGGNLLSCAEERLPSRGATTEHDRAHRAGAGGVHGSGVAHCSSHAARPNLP